MTNMIALELWRARVGTFLQPGPKARFRAPTISIKAAIALRVLIWVTLVVGTVANCDRPVNLDQGQWDLTLYSQNCNTRDIFLALGNNLPMQSTHATALVARMQMCGDVELNPGPPGPGPDRRQTRLTTLHDKSLADEIKALKIRMETVEKENQKLKLIVDRLENQSRRNNLIFHGIQEAETETWEECDKKVRDSLAKEFGIDADSLQIERAHRLGKKKRVAGCVTDASPEGASQDGASESSQEGASSNAAEPTASAKPRPVIVKFLDWKQKSSVLQQIIDAKSENVKAKEDFSFRVRNIRRQLIPYMVELRKKNPLKKVFLSFDKLKVDSKTYTLEDLAADK